MSTAKLDLSDRLDTHVQALSAQTPDAAVVEAAQQRLENVLAGQIGKHHAGRASRKSGLTYGALAAALVLAVLLMPVLFTNQGNAFAAVQAHLRNFTTLTMIISQQANGMTMPDVHVWTDRKGDARVNIGDISSVIVNADSGIILSLLHDSHQAMRMTVNPSNATRNNSALNWLKSVQTFQGKAILLKDSKTIDGIPTRGWSLQINGMHIVLWADSDGIPRAVNISGDHGATYTQHIKLQIDTPIDAAKFSTELPEGYKLMKQN